MNLLQDVEQRQLKSPKDIPKFNVGDTVRVHFRIVEGEKERVQIFEGVVISRKGSESSNATFTVRRTVFGEGLERVFPLHSPRVEDVVVTREGRVRRAKLHYLRERSGKSARVKAKTRTTSEKEAARSAAEAEKNRTLAPAAKAEAPESATAEADVAPAQEAEKTPEDKK